MKIPKRLQPLLEDGLIDGVVRQLMSGKAAMVFVVRCGDETRCAKVYKEADKRSFQQAVDYTENRKTKNTRQARAMAKRTRFGRKAQEDARQSAEVDALYRLAAAGVRVPKPYNFHEGVLLMELVTDERGDAAPRLNDVVFTPEEARQHHATLLVPLLERVLAADPGNLDATLRLATAHSSLGHAERALAAFEQARAIAPRSADVATYLALHYARGAEWPKAAPLLEQVLAESPDRLPAIEALAVVRERQRRLDEAIALRQRIYALRPATPAEQVRLGELAMSVGRTPLALESFEAARRAQGPAFRSDLELGVLTSTPAGSRRRATRSTGSRPRTRAQALFTEITD